MTTSTYKVRELVYLVHYIQAEDETEAKNHVQMLGLSEYDDIELVEDDGTPNSYITAELVA